MTAELLDLAPLQERSVRESTARLNLWLGAVRSGKTVASLLRFVLAVQLAPRHGVIIVVAKTLDTAARNVFGPLQDPALFGPLARHVRYTRGAATATILGRKVEIITGNDARAESRLRGLTACLAYVDEVTLLPESFFAQLLARLSVPGAQLFGTTNPDAPRHWLRVKYLQRAADLDLRSWNFTLDDNPRLDPDFVANLKRELTGVFYRRNILGEWVAGEGSVFSMFDEARHVTGRLPALERILGVGVDFGMNHPTHAVMLALAADGRLVVTSEYRYDAKLAHGAQKTVAEVSAELKQWIGDDDPEWVFVDPSAEVLEVQLVRDGLRRVRHADNAVLDGIRMVASLLATDQLVIHESCAGLIEELPSYAWDERAAERGDEKPVKSGDDACDSLRYVIRSSRGLWQHRLRNPLLMRASDDNRVAA